MVFKYKMLKVTYVLNIWVKNIKNYPCFKYMGKKIEKSNID